jgi:radical SAM protein with 4Fe4S-binding SPASM domain
LVPDDDVEASKWATAILYQWREYDILVALLHRQQHPNTKWLGKASVVPKPKRTEPCFDGLSSLVVRWDGETTFCCGNVNTIASLGNVRDKTLQEMWVSNELWAIRRNIMALDYEAVAPCRECTVVKQEQRTITLPFELRDKLEM